MDKADVVIITCFSAYEPRVDYIKKKLEEDYKVVKVISTNFKHREKEIRHDSKNDYMFLNTMPYKKNLSLTRLVSHYYFSKKAIKFVKKFAPEILYVLIPANSLCKFSAKYKKKHNCKLVFDIVDLWPESLPIGPSVKKLYPFYLWKRIRSNYLKYADRIITECDLYHEVLKSPGYNLSFNTVYWPQEQYEYIFSYMLDEYNLEFLYLGSINNIIDIDTIIKLLNKVQQKVNIKVHIVGGGEKKDILINNLKKNGIPYKYYGFIYNHSELQKIANHCHWAINIMKSSIQVGLTMKSVSYLELGIPLLNNLRGDSWEMVEEYQIGINLTSELDNFTFLSIKELIDMRKRSREVFEKKFSENAFSNQLSSALKSL